jgi:Na+-driven multidrug efflux pump
VANIALNFLLIPQWAVLGAVVATLISYAVSVVLLVVLVRQNVKINWLGTELIKPMLFATITILLSLLLKPIAVVSFFSLILSICFLVGFSLLAILLMKLLNTRETTIVQSLFHFR